SIPGVLTTCSKDGIPNVIALTYVHLVDARHVAVSRQFFRKTWANLQDNPLAIVAVMDPITIETYRLALRFDHEETSGALFDYMAARVDAVAAVTGMAGVFRLQAVIVFEVLDAVVMPGVVVPDDAPQVPAIDAMTQLRALRRISDCARADDTE